MASEERLLDTIDGWEITTNEFVVSTENESEHAYIEDGRLVTFNKHDYSLGVPVEIAARMLELWSELQEGKCKR